MSAGPPRPAPHARVPRPPVDRRRRWWLLAALALALTLPAPASVALLAVAFAARIAVAVGSRVRAARAERLARAAVLAEGAIVLGTDPAGRMVALRDRELSAHGLVLGASGAGKSTTLLRILGERIRSGGPVVAIDLKGSPAFASELAAAAAASGRRLRIWTPDGPERWNPLAHGNATELKDKLIATERFTEPHYQRAAERYVQAAIRCLQELDPLQPVTLRRVVELLEPRRLAAAAGRLAPERAAEVRAYLTSLSPDQASAVRGLASRLAIITEAHTGRFLEPGTAPGAPPIDLRRALTGEEVVLFSLNSSTYGALSAQLGTIAVQDLVSAAGHRLASGETRPAIVAIDEFSALGSDNVGALLSRGREAGVSVLLATQELADLDRAARGLRDQVIGNTAVKIAHRQDVPESAQAVARLAGTERVWEPTFQVGAGRGARTVRGGTLRLVQRDAVDPNRVRTFAPGEALVIVKAPISRTGIARILPPSRRGLER